MVCCLLFKNIGILWNQKDQTRLNSHVVLLVLPEHSREAPESPDHLLGSNIYNGDRKIIHLIKVATLFYIPTSSIYVMTHVLKS